MSRKRNRGRRTTRRSLFETSFAAAIAAFACPEVMAGDDKDQPRVQPYDQVQPETNAFGWIRWLMNGQIDPHAEMTLGIVHLDANKSNPLHVHPNSAEYVYIISGTSEHLVNDRWVLLKPGDVLRVPKGVPHQARTKDEPCRSLVVYDTPKRVMVPVEEKKPEK